MLGPLDCSFSKRRKRGSCGLVTSWAGEAEVWCTDEIQKKKLETEVGRQKQRRARRFLNHDADSQIFVPCKHFPSCFFSKSFLPCRWTDVSFTARRRLVASSSSWRSWRVCRAGCRSSRRTSSRWAALKGDKVVGRGLEWWDRCSNLWNSRSAYCRFCRCCFPSCWGRWNLRQAQFADRSRDRKFFTQFWAWCVDAGGGNEQANPDCWPKPWEGEQGSTSLDSRCFTYIWWDSEPRRLKLILS